MGLKKRLENKKPASALGLRRVFEHLWILKNVFLAEKGGFEPPVGYEPTHAFQACDLNHSSISPTLRFSDYNCLAKRKIIAWSGVESSPIFAPFSQG